MGKQHILQGFIQESDCFEAGLCIGDDIIADYFYSIEGLVNVSFYISNEEKTLEEFKENQILSISGAVDANYGAVYSDYTGYLWTNEEVKIGNHDLLSDLYDHKGKYCLLIINEH